MVPPCEGSGSFTLEIRSRADWFEAKPVDGLTACGALLHWNSKVKIAPVKVSPVLSPGSGAQAMNTDGTPISAQLFTRAAIVQLDHSASPAAVDVG